MTTEMAAVAARAAQRPTNILVERVIIGKPIPYDIKIARIRCPRAEQRAVLCRLCQNAARVPRVLNERKVAYTR